jgi:HK97 family phage major capsid protein
MDLNEKRQKLGEMRAKLTETNKDNMTPEALKTWTDLKGQYDALNTEIKTAEEDQAKAAERQTFLTLAEANAKIAINAAIKPPVVDAAVAKSAAPLKLFKNFGEQLRSIRAAAVDPAHTDDRLFKINREVNAALGANESLPEEGGFAVQLDFAGMIMESAVSAGSILGLVDKYEIGAGSNGAKWIDLDETSVATTVFGGVQVYWAAESNTATAAKPKIYERKLELEKLMGIAYATYEMDQDSTFTSQLYTKAFTLAIQREGERCIIAGNGAGQPLGVLNSPGLVTVNKETGQAASTIMYENIVHMWGRLLPAQKAASVWLVNPDLQEILDLMSFPIGVGGVPVYLPAGGISADGLSSLKGRPVIPTDLCPALSSLGDIILLDPTQWMMIYKGGIDSATSIHVQFLTAENCYRFIFRMNGLPKRKSPLTLKNSSNARSSYVTLGPR